MNLFLPCLSVHTCIIIEDQYYLNSITESFELKPISCCRPHINRPHYMIYPEKVTMDENMDLCRLINTTVPIPKDDFDNQILFTEVKIFRKECSFPIAMVWLGISKEKKDDAWLDRYTKTPITYNNFPPSYRKSGFVYSCGKMTNDALWADALCTYSRCGACLLQRTEFLVLRGLCFENRLETRFYPRGYAGGRPRFHSFGEYVLMWVAEELRWCLYNTATNQTIASLKASGVLAPFGVREWKMDTKMCGVTDDMVNISLSSCNDDMFTCTSGRCIGLIKRCDLLFDCEDGSDEEDCGLVNIPKNYLRYLPSRGPDNSPLPLTPVVTLARVAHVDNINMAIDVEFTVSITWRDDRLSFQHLSTLRKKFISKRIVNKLWTPRYQILNLVDAKYKLLDNVVVLPTAEGAELPKFNSIKRGKFIKQVNTVIRNVFSLGLAVVTK